MATNCRADNHTEGGRHPSGFTLFELVVVLALFGLLVGIGWPALRKSLVRARLRHAARMLKVQLAKTRLKAIRTGTPYRFSYQPGGAQFQLVPLLSQASQPAIPSEDTPAGGFAATDDFSSDVAFPSVSSTVSSRDGSLQEVEPSAAGCDTCQAGEPLWLPQGVTFADPAVEEFVENSSLSEQLARAAAGQLASETSSMGPVRLDRPAWVIQWHRPPAVETSLVEMDSAGLSADTRESLAGDSGSVSSLSQDSFFGGAEGGRTVSGAEMAVPLIFQPDGRTQNARLTLLGPSGYRIDIYVRGLTGEIWVSDVYRVVLDTSAAGEGQPTDQSAGTISTPPVAGQSNSVLP